MRARLAGIPRMGTLERYLARQIYASVGFVLLGFLALFAFFDLIRELGDLGNGDYQLRQVFTFVLLSQTVAFLWVLAQEPAERGAQPPRTH